MKILAIETSCDDTAVAVLEIRNSKVEIKSNIVSSQEIHANYGGVFPMMAKREHQNNLLPVLKKALKESKLLVKNSKIKIQNENRKFKIIKKILKREADLSTQLISFLQNYKKPKVDAIAVTYGPGLEPCLWVGVNFAKALSYIWNIPIIPVNHIEAHILVNFLPKINGNSKFEIRNPKQIQKTKSKIRNIKFPAMSLVVSGGHTQLILVKKIGNYKIIGETRDDAAGECFDKAARILGLGYPGGPAIARLTEQPKSQNVGGRVSHILPRPMINTKDYDFSFSGLKTAVLYAIKDKKQDTITKQYLQEMCVEIQQAIIDVLLKKTINATKDYKAKTIILGGGVSANSELRRQFKLKVESEKLKVSVIFPEKHLSTDNALMIAITGYFNRAKKIAWQKLSVNANLRIEG